MYQLNFDAINPNPKCPGTLYAPGYSKDEHR